MFSNISFLLAYPRPCQTLHNRHGRRLGRRRRHPACPRGWSHRPSCKGGCNNCCERQHECGQRRKKCSQDFENGSKIRCKLKGTFDIFLRICAKRRVNLQIPIYKGMNRSILVTPETDDFYGSDGFGDFPFPDPPSEDLIPKVHAVNALVELVSSRPGTYFLP